MDLNVNSLREAGAFTGAPVETEITWKQDGKELTATTYVRKLSYNTVVSDAKQWGGEVTAGRIAACICDKDGKPVFTVEDITGIPTINDPIDNDQDSEDQKEVNNKIRDKNCEIRKRGPLNHNLTIALLNAIAEVNYSSGKSKT